MGGSPARSGSAVVSHPLPRFVYIDHAAPGFFELGSASFYKGSRKIRYLSRALVKPTPI